MSDLKTLLSSTIAARLPVLIIGAPGIGKSDCVMQAAKESGCDIIVSHPVVSDPTDAKGLPWPDAANGEAKFLPFGDLAYILKSTSPLVVLLDDLGQSPPAVQASWMMPILARKTHSGHPIPDHVCFISCSNRRQDRAGVSGILEPVKSRFAAIVELEAHIDDWCTWAFTTDYVPAELVAFLRNKPDLLHDFKPSAEITNTPSPRTWANLAKLQKLGLPENIQFTAFAGAVGEGAATEYSTFLKMCRSLVNIDSILLNPDTADIPVKPDALYAVATGLAYRANPQVFGRITTYCNRLVDAGKGEFATLCIRDSAKRLPELTATAEWTKCMSSPLGKLIMGTIS